MPRWAASRTSGSPREEGSNLSQWAVARDGAKHAGKRPLALTNLANWFSRHDASQRWPSPGQGRTEAMPGLIAQLSPAVDGIRLSLHVLAAAVWVGGQLTLAGLVPTARQLGPDAPRRLARAFARLSWPAYFVLLVTGIWNVAAVSKGQGTAWQVVLGVKIAVVLFAGAGAYLHGRARTPTATSIWGAVAGVASLAALVMGVFLAG
jgi:hypothetical protein